jgi:hypothetical protein
MLKTRTPPSLVCRSFLRRYGAISRNRLTRFSSTTSWHSSFPPHRGGNDPSHPLVRSRRVWTTPELREQMRHLRQPVGAFSRESGRNMTSTSLTSVWRGEWCFNDHARDTRAEAQSAAGAGNSPPRLAGAPSAGVPRGALILPIKTLSLFSSTADLSSTKGAEPWTTPTPHQQRPRHKPP